MPWGHKKHHHKGNVKKAIKPKHEAHVKVEHHRRSFKNLSGKTLRGRK